jgi:phosphatidate phosphatase APP1
MPDWRQEARAFATAAEHRLWRGVTRLERVFDRDAYAAAGYRGYGTRENVLVLGRVLQLDEIRPDVGATSRLRNLAAALTRIESDPLPHARVRVSLGGAPDDVREIVADDEGFFREWIGTREPLPEGDWVPVRLELSSGGGASARGGGAPSGGGGTPGGGGGASVETIAHALIPPPGAAFGVISDMDDTVLQSNVASFLRAARLVLLENARTRMPFPGVAAFYRALRAGSGLTGPNPIFYVSKSPWNLYDVIVQFLERQEIPLGPLLLRDWDLIPERAAKGFKTREIELIFQTYPSLPFILIGDTTQKDPEIYREIVRAFPGRVLAVYIRNVAAGTARTLAVKKLAEELAAENATLILADDTSAMAAHAAGKGWIDTAALAGIAGDTRADEGRTGDKEPV